MGWSPPISPADWGPPPPRPQRPRRAVFALEGRAAPGLYVAGWALTLFGLAVLGFLAVANPLSRGLALDVLIEAALAAVGLGLMAGGAAQAFQRKADGVTGYFGPSPFLLFAAVFFLAGVILVPLDGLFSTLGIKLDASTSTLVNLLVNLLVYVGLVHVLVVGTGALTWREIVRPGSTIEDTPPAPQVVYGAQHPLVVRPRRDYVGDVGFALALLIPVLVVTVAVELLLVALLRLDLTQTAPTIPVGGPVGERWVLLLAAAAVAPLGEEIFFRGYATNAWARTMSVTRAIVVGGLFFAFVHVLGVQADKQVFEFALFAFVARIPVAVALGWLFVWRRSLVASFTLHASYNAALLLIAWAAASSVQ